MKTRQNRGFYSLSSSRTATLRRKGQVYRLKKSACRERGWAIDLQSGCPMSRIWDMGLQKDPEANIRATANSLNKSQTQSETGPVFL